MRTLLRTLIIGTLLFNFSVAKLYAVEDPLQLVETTSQKMLDALKSKREELKKDRSLVYDLVSDIVLPHFDFVAMSKWVLGKNWRIATKDEKLRFVRAFRNLLVRTYGVALIEYTDEKITYQPIRDDISSGDVTVRTEVTQKSGPSVTIIYKLHLRDDKWKVYDVTVDGVSLISNYRTSFASDVKQKGLPALIERLEQHNEADVDVGKNK